MSLPKPTICRMVCYVKEDLAGGGTVPAVIVKPIEDRPAEFPVVIVLLCILDPDSGVYFRNVKHDEAQTPGTWHWPPRE